jgi:hypothetical protein
MKSDNPVLPLLAKRKMERFVAAILLIFFVIISGCGNTKETVKLDIPSRQAKIKIAVLPIENLSATTAPLKDIRLSLIDGLRIQGATVIEEQELERFMAKYRVRYVGGIETLVTEALKRETGTDAVLITSLEFYSERVPPKLAMVSRLVSTGNRPVILWTDGVGLSGDDSRGILDLGLIEDPKALMKKALQALLGSLNDYLSDKKKIGVVKGVKRKFQPKISYRSEMVDEERKYTVAVIPFFNSSGRKYGGEILALHFIKTLKEFENFDPVEPGLVRQQFLNLRLIMDEGVSLRDADAIFSSLDVDLVLTGKVIDYQDYQGLSGTPKVDFSTQVTERKSREVVWSSGSYNTGDDGVFFFDWGKVNTAYAMASQMTKSIAERIVRGKIKVPPAGETIQPNVGGPK